MNVRRLKKKKGICANKDQEEIAQDKLFQISYLCDQKYVDQSHILTIDQRFSQESQSRTLRKTQQLKQVNTHHKKYSIIKLEQTKEDYLQSKLEEPVCQLKISQKEDGAIFNTLHSAHVFVGSNFKGKRRIQDKKQLIFDVKKRVETMPLMPKLEPISNRPYLKTQNSYNKQSEIFYTNEKQKLLKGPLARHHYLHSFSNNKKLKQKIRLDLFMKTLTSTLRQK